MKWLPIMAALAFLCGAERAQSAQTLIGPTMRTCEDFSADKTRVIVTTTWIAGYVSGVNAMTPSDFLKGVDLDDVLKSVAESCQGHPDKTILAVARDVVAKFQKE
jgi:hypothetical protein